MNTYDIARMTKHPIMLRYRVYRAAEKLHGL